MNGITFNRQNGGLGRRLPGEDHISGLIILADNVIEPSLVTSIQDYEDLEDGQWYNNYLLHYHVSEYFRINPGSQLYVMSVGAPDGSFDEIRQLQQFAGGKIRQLGIADLTGNSAVIITPEMASKITQILNGLAQNNTPLSVVYHNANPALSINLSSLPDLSVLAAERLSVLIGEDASGRGAYIFDLIEARAGIVGAVLGAMSRAKVNESIGWVERQNLVTTAYQGDVVEGMEVARELDVPCFIDGTPFMDLTPGQIQTLHNKGYIFCVKYPGLAGTYLNDSFTATARNSDYAYIENNRTADKAQRGVYAALLPKISGPVMLDPATGFIREDVVASLEALAAQALEQMERDGEISGFNVFINPEQEVLQTSVLQVTLSVVPVGVMRNIVVNLGFALQV